ncbi:DUF896 domain-containing protein [Niallia taxi]|nr:DUF896 domain-containing protein [Niallia taxi]MDE5054426.1 DUF896 domain-containing protein [Niallia taxi]
MDILKRINELSKIEKEQDLTNAERVEQQVLREDYLRLIRGQVLSSFKGMKIIDPLGNDVTPIPIKDLQKRNEQDHE